MPPRTSSMTGGGGEGSGRCGPAHVRRGSYQGSIPDLTLDIMEHSAVRVQCGLSRYGFDDDALDLKVDSEGVLLLSPAGLQASRSIVARCKQHPPALPPQSRAVAVAAKTQRAASA